MRKLVILTLIVLGALSAQGQSMRFGLTFSPQLAWLKIDNSQLENGGLKAGFHYGMLVDFFINENENYAFSTGLIISHTGGVVDSRDTILLPTAVVIETSRKLNLQYLEIPATIRLRTNEIGYMTYFGQFGIVPGINIRAREDVDIDPDPLGTSSYENKKADDINILNLAMYLSAGAEYSLGGSTSILAGIFYHNGFTNVVNDKDGDKIAISNLGLKIGVLF